MCKRQDLNGATHFMQNHIISEQWTQSFNTVARQIEVCDPNMPLFPYGFSYKTENFPMSQ